MLIKNIKIFIELIKMNLKMILEYRVLFFTEMFTMSLWSLAYIIFVEVIFLHTDSLAGWDKYQTLFILAFYYAFQAFAEIFYIDNFENFSLTLRRGLLDFALVKPVSSRLLIFMQNMKFQDFSHFIITAMLFSYAMGGLKAAVDPWFLVIALLMVLPATVLNFCIHSLVSTVAFWLEKNETLSTIMWNFRQTAKYPRQIYKGVFEHIFTFLIPFAILASVPAEVAMQFPNTYYPFALLALTVIFFVVSKWFWNKGLKRYASAN